MTVATRLSGGRSIVLACSIFALASGIQHARASSADAWEEFHQDVEKACLVAASETLLVGSIKVDPYGSESYGFAVMIGIEPGTSNERLVACAYDKRAQAAEISGYFER